MIQDGPSKLERESIEEVFQKPRNETIHLASINLVNINGKRCKNSIDQLWRSNELSVIMNYCEPQAAIDSRVLNFLTDTLQFREKN
jgi:hypothetical protein